MDAVLPLKALDAAAVADGLQAVAHAEQHVGVVLRLHLLVRGHLDEGSIPRPSKLYIHFSSRA